MKDIKIFLIGFLTCSCIFLIMGQTKVDQKMYVDGEVKVNPVKYQFSVQRGVDIGETYYLYDNETEDVQILHAYKADDGEQKWSSINVNFRRNYTQGLKDGLEAIKKAKSGVIGK